MSLHETREGSKATLTCLLGTSTDTVCTPVMILTSRSMVDLQWSQEISGAVRATVFMDRTSKEDDYRLVRTPQHTRAAARRKIDAERMVAVRVPRSLRELDTTVTDESAMAPAARS